MHLYFLRHGIAEDIRPGISNADRRLTPGGIMQMRQAGAGLAALKVHIDTIYSSPYPRALETAQIVAEALGHPTETVQTDHRLASGEFTFECLQEILVHHAPDARVMLVGHAPDLALTAGALIGGGRLDLKKGGLIRMEAHRIEPGSGVLRWLLVPEHLLSYPTS